jgi:hypothetical protein
MLYKATYCLISFLFAASAAYAADQTGDMSATYASGGYKGVQNATLDLHTSGNGAPDALTFTASGSKLTTLVWKTEISRCGNRYYAHTPDTSTEVTFTDYSGARCRMFVRHKWHAQLGTRERDGTVSVLLLEGDPLN